MSKIAQARRHALPVAQDLFFVNTESEPNVKVGDSISFSIVINARSSIELKGCVIDILPMKTKECPSLQGRMNFV